MPIRCADTSKRHAFRSYVRDTSIVPTALDRALFYLIHTPQVLITPTCNHTYMYIVNAIDANADAIVLCSVLENLTRMPCFV